MANARTLGPILIVLSAAAGLVQPSSAKAQELTAEEVLTSIENARDFLVSRQRNGGSWSSQRDDRHRIGVTSLTLLALINAGMTVDDPPVQKALKYLRNVPEPNPSMTYELSLMIMALAAAKDGARDKARLAVLAGRLEAGQIRRGGNSGTWSYNVTERLIDIPGDRSNGQFAILGLRDAAQAGIPVSRDVWKRAQDHWLRFQNADGGWGYSHHQHSTGSMTVAGIATLLITNSFLQTDDDVGPDGRPVCCPNGTESPAEAALERGIHWLESRFTVGHNAGSNSWLLYYLYGLERAGRLSARRFFGDHDWYREGARFLIDRQSERWGSWQGVRGSESDPIVGTSFALLFLSKGLAPVLINKLKFGPRDPAKNNAVLGNDWNHHTDDVRNLTDLISGLPKWPKLVTWQVVDTSRVAASGGVADLLQAPIAYLSGRDSLELSAEEVQLLRGYIDAGGFVFAVNNCGGAGFHDGVRELVRQMYPDGESELRKLPADHPVFHSEYPLDPASVELWGVDFGCRTGFIYSPDDISCLWDKWARHDPPNRPAPLKTRILKATRIGVNVVAYATGREPPIKLHEHQVVDDGGRQDLLERGFLQVAKLRHTGGWDTAPQALRNLLVALNRSVGMAASTRSYDLPISDPQLFKYPIVYMHGRNPFRISPKGREQLKLYLERGGVLFADACCGSKQFDDSFRHLVEQLFPEQEFARIPVGHEIFQLDQGFDIRQVRRRVLDVNRAGAALKTSIRRGEAILEGITVGDRYAIIYSKYDISCALERQASVDCSGYLSEDATRIAINVILYGLLQDVGYAKVIEEARSSP